MKQFAPVDTKGNGNGTRAPLAVAPATGADEAALHPAWRAFLRYCRELGYGEIEKLKIQDGLPVLAELTTKKVKFSS